MGSGPRWSAADDARLIEMALAGVPEKASAAALGRSIEAARARRTLLRQIGRLPPAIIGRPRRPAADIAPPAPGFAPPAAGFNRAGNRGKTADPREPAMRRCLGLGCGKTFKSAHAGIRLCPKCRTRTVSPYAPAH